MTTSPNVLPTWQQLAATHTVEEMTERLRLAGVWDPATIADLSSTAIATGAWLNTGVRDLRLGNRPVGETALTPAIERNGLVTVARYVREAMEFHDEHWWLDVAHSLYDSPYGYRLFVDFDEDDEQDEELGAAFWDEMSDWVVVFECVEDIVGRERFVLGTALAAIDDSFNGLPQEWRVAFSMKCDADEADS